MNNPNVELINKKQLETLNILHRGLWMERDRRQQIDIPIPVVDFFLPTGDGYFLLCSPKLSAILDISDCIMSLLFANCITGYFVAHIGDVNIFTDMTGKGNATGFELGYASRLQSVCKETGKLICSKKFVDMWKENEYFELQDEWSSATDKDDVEYNWRIAIPKDIEHTSRRFKPKKKQAFIQNIENEK